MSRVFGWIASGWIAVLCFGFVGQLTAAVGTLVPLAGTGTTGAPSPDGTPALSTQLCFTLGIAVDGAGNVFYSDHVYYLIRRIDAVTHLVATVVGGGTSTADGVNGLATRLNMPTGIRFDGNGDLLFCDTGNGLIRQWNPATQQVVTVASLAATNIAIFDADHIVATDNSKVWKVNTTTHAVTLLAGASGAGFSGDGGPATMALFNYPSDVAVDSNGNAYIADQQNRRVREVAAATGYVSTIAGNGLPMTSAGYTYNGPATGVGIGNPDALALSNNKLFVSNQPNLWQMDLVTENMTCLVGDVSGASRYFSGMSVAADSADLGQCFALDADQGGNVYIATVDYLIKYVPPPLLQQLPPDAATGFHIYHGIFHPGLNESCTVALNPPDGSKVKVEIFDAAARRIRILFDGAAPSGTLAKPWDGRDDQGALVSSGTYAIRVSGGGGTQIRRVVVIR